MEHRSARGRKKESLLHIYLSYENEAKLLRNCENFSKSMIKFHKGKVENSSQVALKCRRTRSQLQSQTLHPARDCLLHEDLNGQK